MFGDSGAGVGCEIGGVDGEWARFGVGDRPPAQTVPLGRPGPVFFIFIFNS